MKTLSKKRIELFLDSISENYCETVLKDCYVLLKKMYTYYSKPNGPEFNIMNKVKCSQSQKEKKEKRGYTPEELKRIFAVADSINPETNRPKYMYGNAVKLLLHTEITLLINAFRRYEFDLTAAKSEITVIEFAAADEKWLDFICNNRSGKPTGDYDTQILLNTQIRATSSLKINWLLYILLNC